MPNKITHLVERHGEQKGILTYVVVNILLYLLIGLVVMYCGWTLM